VPVAGSPIGTADGRQNTTSHPMIGLRSRLVPPASQVAAGCVVSRRRQRSSNATVSTQAPRA